MVLARGWARIQEVRQSACPRNFPEGRKSPWPHPVCGPQSYMEDQQTFYTATVYEKGGGGGPHDPTLIGRENFRKGMDLYFQPLRWAGP